MIESELEYTYGGGGLVIVFIPYQQHQKTQYTISNCKFEDNSANIRKVNWDSKKGGGMSLIFFHYSQDIYIKLENCYFKNNTGSLGGGLFTPGIVITVPTVTWLFTIQSSMVIMLPHHLHLIDEEKAGGGVQLGYSINPLRKN